MMTVPDEVWKKASFSGQDSDCVEVSNQDRVRDSKNPDGPVLRFTDHAPLAALLNLVR